MAADGKTEDAGAGTAPRAFLNYVNGRFCGAADGTTLNVTNPATDEVLGTVPRSKAVDVDEAANAAWAALKGPWAKWSYLERAAVLDRIADAIAARADELAKIESQDSGKLLSMAQNVDIPRAVANFRFYAGLVRYHESDCHLMPDAINYTTRGPVGVCGLITPWNLPIYLLSWKVAPALALGNTVVAKPSELTPRTASVLAEIIDSVGLPPGVFNLVHGFGHEAGGAIVGHERIKAISFTGGTVTGKVVASIAAPLFKKISLELGGKNATLIFKDCDFDKTVAGALRSAFLNQGQVCLAGSRILVERPIYDKFVEAFVAKVKEMKVGDPLDPSSNLGPVSSLQHREKIESYVALAKEEGGRILTGGDRPDLPAPFNKGAFINPCVVVDLPPTSRTSTEEIFGPLVTIHAFDTEDEAVEAANCVRYGLAGSIWTTNLATAHRVAERVESGLLWVNCWLHRDLRTPFGGVKDSGTGREGGKYSIEFYSEPKNVCIYTGRP